jgi:pyridoxal phosphate enzyme (YggS family)
MKVNESAVRNIIKEIAPAILVAATKYVGIEEINALEKLGVTIFGENKVQALLDKYEQYHGQGQFHMIGTLQKNKVKYIIDKVSLIHSVDTLSLAKEIQKQAQKHELVMPILLQVNISREISKHGFDKAEIEEVLKEIETYSNIAVRGLMMMAPNQELSVIEKYFKETRDLLVMLQKDFPNISLQELSMGMSQDYSLAITYGATFIRIGSALFTE